MIKEVEAYDVEGIPISEILKLVSEDARRQYEMGQSMVTFGTIFGIVGFIVCIAGIAAPSKKPEIVIHQPPQKELSKPDRRCPNCGRIIPFDAVTCPYCSKKFESDSTEKKVEEEPKSKETKKKNKAKSPKHCPDCGVKLEEEDLNFCPNCGNKFE
jgi:hypothetical protein